MTTSDHLSESQYTVRVAADGVTPIKLKSCPRCSRAAGHLVYYPLEDYGDRMIAGKPIIQSYCKSCRGESGKEAQS